MPEQLGFHHDARRCTGCRTCVMACRNQNRLEPGLQYREVFAYREDPNSPGRHYLSVGCNHCEQPECVRVCPRGAYRKRADGIVVHDPARCTGCRLCVVACPHHAPHYSPRQRKTYKCNLCESRLAAGQQPACVAACPTFALTLIDLTTFDDPQAQATVPGIPDSDLTRPSSRFTVPDGLSTERRAPGGGPV